MFDIHAIYIYTVFDRAMVLKITIFPYKERERMPQARITSWSFLIQSIKFLSTYNLRLYEKWTPKTRIESLVSEMFFPPQSAVITLVLTPIQAN